MNTSDYYNRQKEFWNDRELENLKKEYEVEQFTISQIADIHQRTPGSIAYKLRNLKLIPYIAGAKGYEEYRASALYKEIVERGKKQDAEKKQKKEMKLKEKIQSLESKMQTNVISELRKGVLRTNEISELGKEVVRVSEISELRKEVASLKKDVKEMLRLINAIYQFETEEVD